MSNTGIESNTHTATRLDDDDPVPGQDSPAHDTRRDILNHRCALPDPYAVAHMRATNYPKKWVGRRVNVKDFR